MRYLDEGWLTARILVSVFAEIGRTRGGGLRRQVRYIPGEENVQRDGSVLDVVVAVQPELHNGVIGFDTPEQRDPGLGVLHRLEPTVHALGALRDDLHRQRHSFR